MQALNVKQVLKAQLAITAVEQALIEQFKKSDEKAAKVVELKVVDPKVAELKAIEPGKAPSFNRTLEAYGDCV